MSLLWRLLGHRPHKDDDLPDTLPPDPEPEAEPEAEEPEIPEQLPPETPGAPPIVLHLTDADFARAAKALNVDVAAVRAVAEIEAAGRGFLPDGRPQILFEAHIFHRQTGGRHAHARDSQGRALSSTSWNRALYGAAGAWQHERLAAAAALDWEAAHRSASWGLFQVLGSNHAAVGHPTIHGFVEAMHAGAGPHLDAFVEFVKANRLDGALRRHDWQAFARGYNGPAFAQNRYDAKLRDAHRKWSAAS